jgi:hypothetical protein
VLQLEVEHFDPALRGALGALPAVAHVVAHPTGTDGIWSLALHTTDSRGVLPGLIELVGAKSGRIRHLQIAQPTLEDVVIAHTGKALRD